MGDNIKIDLQAVELGVQNVARDKSSWRALVNAVMNLLAS